MFSVSSSTANAAYALVFYLAIPAFLLSYPIRSFSRRHKIYVSVAYTLCVLRWFTIPIFVFYVLRWIVIQILRGCKALAWFGFYLTFFMSGMQFVMKGFWGIVEFLEALVKASEEHKEEERLKEEAERREARAQAANPPPDPNGGDTEESPKKQSKKSKRKK